MVDTKDLKSFGHCGCAGSSPASGTIKSKRVWKPLWFPDSFLSYLSRFSFPAFHCEVCTHDDEGYAEQLSHVE